MQTYKFTAKSTGEMFELPAPGGYIYYSECASGLLNPTIRVRTPDGDRFNIKPGQGKRAKADTKLWWIENVDQVADIVGYLQIAAVDEGFEDHRIQGDVSIIDGGKASTLSGLAFSAGAACAALAANYSIIQLAMPAGTTRAIVEQIIGSSAVAGALTVQRWNTLVTDQGAQPSKLIDGTSSAAHMYTGTNAAPGTGGAFTQTDVAAGVPIVVPQKRPYVIKPGKGLIVYGPVNSRVTASFDWYEEPDV